MGQFSMLEEATEVPILCWVLDDEEKRTWTLYDLSDRLRMHGWQIPAYPLPADMEDVTCQRIVCRADLSMSLAIKCVNDMKAGIKALERMGSKKSKKGKGKKRKQRVNASFDHSGR